MNDDVVADSAQLSTILRVVSPVHRISAFWSIHVKPWGLHVAWAVLDRYAAAKRAVGPHMPAIRMASDRMDAPGEAEAGGADQEDRQ